MNVCVSGQTAEFIYSALLGVFLGAVYDIFRLARVYLKSGKFMTGFLDVIYWMIAIAGLIGFVLTACGGQMHWYVLVGTFCGGFVYLSALSYLFFRSLDIIIKICVQFINLLVKPVYILARCGLRVMRRTKHSVKKKAKSFIERRRKKSGEEAEHCDGQT